MRTRLLRSYLLEVLQTLTAAVVLLGLFTSTIWEPAWAADAPAATTPAASTSSAAKTGPPAKAPQPPSATAPPDIREHKTSTQSPSDLTLQTANEKLQQQSPVFIENRGQFDDRVKFLVKGSGANLWLTNEASFSTFSGQSRSSLRLLLKSHSKCMDQSLLSVYFTE